jgi:hypothetical protein
MSTSIAATSTAGLAAVDSFTCETGGLSTEERLLALTVFQQARQLVESKTSINLSAEQLDRLREQVHQALEEARDAKKDSGFWGGLAKIFKGDIATLAMAVAAVAACIATGGAAAAVLAVVAAAASFAASHAKELGIPESVAVGIAVAASAAALCCGNASGLVQVATTLKDAATAVKTVATAGAAVAQLSGAGCGVAAAKYDQNAGQFSADARGYQGAQELTSGDIDEALDRLQESLERQDATTRLASDIQRQTAASNQAILNNWGGAA